MWVSQRDITFHCRFGRLLLLLPLLRTISAEKIERMFFLATFGNTSIEKVIYKMYNGWRKMKLLDERVHTFYLVVMIYKVPYFLNWKWSFEELISNLPHPQFLQKSNSSLAIELSGYQTCITQTSKYWDANALDWNDQSYKIQLNKVDHFYSRENDVLK